MEKKLLKTLPDTVPEELRKFADGAKIFDSSCSPEARVYFIEKDEGYFLKHSAAGTLAKESELTSYFYSKGFGAEVLQYSRDTSDWLLTKRVAGEDCTHDTYISDPKRLCDTIASYLRKLHELDFTNCPVMDRNIAYLATAEKNYRTRNYDTSIFPDSFGYRSAEEAYSVLTDGKEALSGRVLLHGDYCLPNVILDNWQLSAFIDLGNGGVGDRHIDLFWGTWTLWFNLKTTKYCSRFLDAYGRDKVDESLLNVVAAAEVFG